MGELEKTETRLVAQLKQMINIADEEKENLEAVHDKLERQKTVDRQNEVTKISFPKGDETWKQFFKE